MDIFDKINFSIKNQQCIYCNTSIFDCGSYLTCANCHNTKTTSLYYWSSLDRLDISVRLFPIEMRVFMERKILTIYINSGNATECDVSNINSFNELVNLIEQFKLFL